MFDEATLTAERTCEHQANIHDEATLAVKLDAHGEVVYECPANACDEATLAVKLNACSEVVYEHPIIIHGETTPERV